MFATLRAPEMNIDNQNQSVQPKIATSE